MGEVEEKAGAEAEKKGITGEARRAYIGGAFHRIMAHHAGKVKEQKEKRAEHTEKLSASNQEVVRRNKAHDAKMESARQADREIEQRKAREHAAQISTPKYKAPDMRKELAKRMAERGFEAPVAKTKTQLEYEAFLEKKKEAHKDAEEENRLRIGSDGLNDQQREQFKRDTEAYQKIIAEAKEKQKQNEERGYRARQGGSLDPLFENQAKHYADRARDYQRRIEESKASRQQASRDEYKAIAEKHEKEFREAQRREALRQQFKG